jgi:hypothetical protein
MRFFKWPLTEMQALRFCSRSFFVHYNTPEIWDQYFWYQMMLYLGWYLLLLIDVGRQLAVFSANKVAI